MTLTVNQILVIALVLELVVFLVVLVRLVASGLDLLKVAKQLTKDAQSVVDRSSDAVEDAKTKATEIIETMVDNATLVDKGIVATSIFLAFLNFRSLIRRYTFLGKGIIGGYLNRRERKKTQKEYRKTKKEMKKMRKAARKEAKASRKAADMAKEIRNNENNNNLEN